jgi:hypothetical protein
MSIFPSYIFKLLDDIHEHRILAYGNKALAGDAAVIFNPLRPGEIKKTPPTITPSAITKQESCTSLESFGSTNSPSSSTLIGINISTPLAVWHDVSAGLVAHFHQ